MKDKNTIKTVINNLFEKIQGSIKTEIQKIWDTQISEEIKLHARISQLNNNKLYIDVEDSNWLYWLSLNRDIIYNKFKPLISKKMIRDIKMRVKNNA
jgi:predicted nucleic acid-binding Zn ribbon protein